MLILKKLLGTTSIISCLTLLSVMTLMANSADSSKDKIKEFVVLTDTKESIVARLQKLYDRLKLFASSPKELKVLQEETDKLEEALSENVAKIKDINVVISKTKFEIAKLRNEIPSKRTNQDAQKVLDKIIELFNDADKEMSKVTTLSQSFQNTNNQIREKISKINVSVESGNQEINAIKEELEKIAALQEEAAGRTEREIVDVIDAKVNAKKQQATSTIMGDASTSQPTVATVITAGGAVTSSNAITAADTALAEKMPANNPDDLVVAKQATLTVLDSLLVLGKITFKFISVAVMGAKDLFVRLFASSSTVVTPVTPALESSTAATATPASATATATPATPTSVPGSPAAQPVAGNASAVAPTQSTASQTDQPAENSTASYFATATTALVSLGKATIGLIGNAVKYIQQSYASSAPQPAIEQNNATVVINSTSNPAAAPAAQPVTTPTPSTANAAPQSVTTSTQPDAKPATELPASPPALAALQAIVTKK